MKSVREVVAEFAGAVGLTLALLCGFATASAHGAAGGGPGGAPGGAPGGGHGVGHGAGHVGGAPGYWVEGRNVGVVREGDWAGYGGGWGGYGYRHYGYGYGCCGWGVGFYYPFWDTSPWYDDGFDYPYVYAAPPVAPMLTAGQYLEPASSYWYYCPDSSTYYPYVQQCASAWQRVAPTPPQMPDLRAGVRPQIRSNTAAMP